MYNVMYIGGHMAQMVRKQIYIKKHQDQLLKRLARSRGVSEAEIVRRAIEQQAGLVAPMPFHSDADAWEQAYRFMLSLQALGPSGLAPRKWNREDAYEERLGRYERHPR